ncbi:proteasome subunit alpha type-1 [Anaeramoeba ignava]|uniref:Proteasome subunit alpha type n=1 Tax=Anaeramoeba ignava TaxID=1746090 RepID=A0A9Q0RGH2_ANAIG|nr:proteasome subunit alpha type-1 [Anaeramoeba ignava]KAJ5080081.1 proteasome subunit alpha type-1 [Anaeramoeba ignava]|eukprot:Anaeramoba_ignava/a349924_97.p1 GENE.a349924_97~~a349924_97.p1  ORF type:complete len:256 (+),score=88.43 a349924_97:82-849(+)
MFRTQYDSDVTTFSPQGRLHQIEYAMEAVKQGSTAIGLKSETHAIVVTLLRSSSDLSSYQQKIFKVDENIGIAIAGLTADARVLLKYMQNETLNHKYVFESPMSVEKLVSQIADKSQIHTQRYGKRPYGVGLLVIGHDKSGVHLFETSPSGNYFNYYAQAIGSRAQSAKTYLEKNFENFKKLSLDDLIFHGLTAIKESSSKEVLTKDNCSVGIVGVDTPFKFLEKDKLEKFLERVQPQDDLDDMDLNNDNQMNID